MTRSDIENLSGNGNGHEPGNDGDARPESENGIRAVEKAFAVLDVLGDEDSPSPVPVSYLVRRTGFHRSSIQRCLSSLLGSGYIEADPAGAGYRLTSRVLRLSQRFARTHNLVACAHPYLLRLREATEETAFLALLSGDDWVPVSQEESNQPLRQLMRLGSPIPLPCGAGGRAILAFSPEDIVSRVLSRSIPTLGPGTVTDPERQRELIGTAKRLGYTIGIHELGEGAAGISSPVFDHEGKVVGTIGVGLPSARCGADRQVAIAMEVRAACIQLSRDLGSRVRFPGGGE